MANYLAEEAPQDGSYIGMMANTLVISQVMGVQAIRYDAAKFHWLGSIMPGTHSTMVVWRTTGITSLEEAKHRELTTGASTKGAFVYTMPALLNEFFGTRFKIITGYQGINAGYVAMERGELDGNAATWAEFKVLHPDYIAEKKVTVLVQNAPRIAELPDVPTLQELARSEDDRRTIELLLSGDRIGRPLAAAPGTPPERVAALRAAFDAAMKDAKFRHDAAQSQTEIDPIAGERMQGLVAQVLATPRPLIERARKIIE
jgi:tripartite-type tricarboxylate transporter receptor subunit TctC